MNLQRLREFWNERAPRERALLGGGALGIALVALYLFLWQPGLAASARLSATLPKLRAQAELMRAQQSEIAALRKSAGKTAQGGDLRVLLQSSVGRAPFAKSVQRIDAASGERATVLVSSAEFGDWLRWVAEAQREAAARLEKCRITALDSPGMVRAEASFVALTAAAGR
ncbi:MAG TPA: type II secretion system protein M [Burkholderiales bacterium]|jgi:general secretion pathway protein M